MNQKLENLLYISLNVSEPVRERSENLNVGYNTVTNLWQVIVRSGQNLSYLEEKYQDITVYSLLENYSVIETTRENVLRIAQEEAVWYMEKPKSFFYGLSYSKLASCIYPTHQENISGKGILVAIIDSGLDLFHPDFFAKDGKSRVVAIWNQQTDEIYHQEDIEQAINRRVPIVEDRSGHGTSVARIACGNQGVAFESDILVVKLSQNNQSSAVASVAIMRALDYAIRFAAERNQPISINLSIGNNYGSHTGDTLLENYLDSVSEVGRNVICVGMGNEAASGIHYEGMLDVREGMRKVLLSVGEKESSLSFQIWKNYVDDIQITLVTPSQKKLGPLIVPEQIEQYEVDGMRILAFWGEPSPYQTISEVYFDILTDGNRNYIESGIWEIWMEPVRIVDGQINIYLPSSVVLNDNTRFLENSPNQTQTIPSTAGRAISVGAYDARTNSYATFSGRGGTVQKPDLVAPGVGIVLQDDVSRNVVSGTSFATPFVTGSAACLMEWGIIKGNDPYLYGEKMKAVLERGAKQFPGISDWPNNLFGFGSLCLDNILAKWYT